MIDQGELFDIPSPCKRICELNNRGYCKGCFRSRHERLYWNQFTTFQKQLVVNLCEKRRLKVLSARQAQPQEEEEQPLPQLELFTQPEADKAEAELQVSAAEQPAATHSSARSADTADEQRSLFSHVPATPAETPEQPADKPSKEATAEKSASPGNKALPEKTAKKRGKGNDTQLDMFS